MSTIAELKKWIFEDLSRWNRCETAVHVADDETGMFRFRLYTAEFRFQILATEREGGGGYLGCTVATRAPRPGEEHVRGNDLADGPFTRETWDQIKNDMIAYSLKEISRTRRSEEDTKEIVVPNLEGLRETPTSVDSETESGKTTRD